MIEGGQRLVVLAEIEIGIAETDLQFGVVGRERAAFSSSGTARSYLCHSAYICAQVGVGELVERIVLQLLVEGFDRVVVLALVPIDAAEIVVGKLVVGIDFDLLLEAAMA